LVTVALGLPRGVLLFLGAAASNSGLVLRGALMGAGLPPTYALYVFAGIAVLGTLVAIHISRRVAQTFGVSEAPGPGVLSGSGVSVLAHE
jgi:hypothetical protein